MERLYSIFCIIIVVLFRLGSLLVVQAEDHMACQTLSPESSCERVQDSCKKDSNSVCFPNFGYELFGNANYQGSNIVCSCQDDTRCASSLNATSIRLSTLSVDLVSISPKYFMIQMAWNLTDTSTDSSGGYELRLRDVNYRRNVRCIRIFDPKVLKFNMTNLSYLSRSGRQMSVEVLPFPVGQYVAEDTILLSKSFRGPSGCVDIEHDGTLCNTRIYGRPEDVRVESSICSDVTKQLDISWNHPTLSRPLDLIPPTYFMLVRYDSNGFRLKIDNSTRIRITHLDARHEYRIRVQAYKYCSGLGNFIDSPNYGCGTISSYTYEVSTSSTCIVSTPPSHPSVSSQKSSGPFTSSSRGADNPLISPSPILNGTIEPSGLILSLSVSLLLLFFILVPFLVLLLILCCRKFCCDKTQYQVHDITNSKVFVFYCETTLTPVKQLQYIQEYVVCRLLNYFEVSTPNDYNRGNVVKWLEEMVTTSPSVLLVCNHEFFSEWTKPDQDRSTVFNSLDLLISSAVSSQTIGKFGIILAGDCKREKCIPDNSYLKAMSVFVMGKDKWEEDRIVQFVTHSKPFKFVDSESMGKKVRGDLVMDIKGDTNSPESIWLSCIKKNCGTIGY